MKVIVLSIFLLYIIARVSSLDNGLGKTPQMGWNSWNHFGCNINENLIKKTAFSIANGPLKAAGYQYVNLDDCWQIARNKSGYIIEDPKAFPSGMPALIDYVHSLGLKFGLYSDAGTYTCGGRPGSLGYEKEDATTYASWKVDYLKYDNCSPDKTKPEVRYPVMRDALNMSGRAIFFSMCEWGVDNPATWAPEVGNSWRTTDDIRNNWASMLSNIDANNNWSEQAGPGAWNDPDMLEVGNGVLSFRESQTHFGLWAISKSPLIIGCDVTNMTNETIQILTNPEVIAINQDALGVQGRKVFYFNNTEVWAGPLSGRASAVLLINRSLYRANITASFVSTFVHFDNARVRDLWARKDLGMYHKSFTAEIESHGSQLLLITY